MTQGPPEYPAGLTVLLADDEEGVRSYCRLVLEGDGAHVVEAVEGAAALRLVQQAEVGVDEVGVDIVITDLLMPAFTGGGK
jgi:CheY-like chemotaxis protein